MDHVDHLGRRLRRRRSAIIAATVLAAVMTACGGGTERWDGSPYSGRPVYGAGADRGVSQQLHDDADECGISDETLDQIMVGVVEGSVTDIESIFEAGGGSAQVALTELDDRTWELQLSC